MWQSIGRIEIANYCMRATWRTMFRRISKATSHLSAYQVLKPICCEITVLKSPRGGDANPLEDIMNNY